MKLLLYGIGQGLDLVEQKIKKEHMICGYTDSYASITIFRGKPFYRLDKLFQCDFDYIIITIKDRKSAWKIYNMLIQDYKLQKEYVIPYYVYANYIRYKIKMENCSIPQIQGLIFGTSHPMYGFLDRELSIPFLNLSGAGQDIYYNYRIFERCITEYDKKLNALQYIVFDLYDYCYFNYDISMASNFFDYYEWGGIPEQHNFQKNHNFKKSFEEELFKSFYSFSTPLSMYKLFENIDARTYDGSLELNRWKHIEKKVPLERGPILGNPVSKRFEVTVMENVNLIELFLQEIKKFNRNIKTIFTLIPRYIEMEYVTEIVTNQWKDEFNRIVKNLCVKYNAVFWNYKERKELSENHMFYYDPVHLNTTGARALTSILNEDLTKLNKYESILETD